MVQTSVGPPLIKKKKQKIPKAVRNPKQFLTAKGFVLEGIYCILTLQRGGI